MEILVLGAGVSGLTTGLRLLEDGHNVRVWAKALPPATTSNVAAAVWYPYKAYPEDKVAVWGAVAYQAFERLAGVAGSGVLLSEVLELLPAARSHPLWGPAVSRVCPSPAAPVRAPLPARLPVATPRGAAPSSVRSLPASPRPIS